MPMGVRFILLLRCQGHYKKGKILASSSFVHSYRPACRQAGSYWHFLFLAYTLKFQLNNTFLFYHTAVDIEVEFYLLSTYVFAYNQLLVFSTF